MNIRRRLVIAAATAGPILIWGPLDTVLRFGAGSWSGALGAVYLWVRPVLVAWEAVMFIYWTRRVLKDPDLNKASRTFWTFAVWFLGPFGQLAYHVQKDWIGHSASLSLTEADLYDMRWQDERGGVATKVPGLSNRERDLLEWIWIIFTNPVATQWAYKVMLQRRDRVASDGSEVAHPDPRGDQT